MIKVEKFRRETEIAHGCDAFPDIAFLGGKTHSQLIEAERRGTEYALYKAGRMNQTIILPEVTPHTIGQLIYFFEMVTAYMGEFLDIDAFNQPGVEESKIASYAELGAADPVYAKKREEMAKRPVLFERYLVQG